MTEDAGDGVRTHVIGSEWDSINEILDSIKEASDGNPGNHYDHIDNATDLVNYVSNQLQTSDKTVQRVQEYFLNDKCPSCETENYEVAIAGDLDSERVDPTLEKYTWTESEESQQHGMDEKVSAIFTAKCGNGHEDMYLIYEESWHQEK